MKTRSTKNNADIAPEVAEAQAIAEELEKLSVGLRKSDDRIQQAAKDLDAARVALANAEANAWKSDQTLPDDAPEAVAVEKATAALSRARAAQGGMRKAIREADERLVAIDERLRAHREKYNASVIATFLNEECAPLREQFRTLLQRAHALAKALGENVDPTQTNGLGQVLRIPSAQDWDKVPACVELHDMHAPLRDLCGRLRAHRSDADTRISHREYEQRMASRYTPFDPSETAKYEVTRQFMAFGRDYVPGDRVDCFVLPLSMLSRLYTSHEIRLLEAEGRWSA